MPLIPLNQQDSAATVAAVAAAIKAGALNVPAWLARLTPQGRAALIAARPLDVLTTGLALWRNAAPAGPARMARTVAAAGFLVAANRITPYIAKAQTEARANA